jgi:hypothetical protein
MGLLVQGDPPTKRGRHITQGHISLHRYHAHVHRNTTHDRGQLAIELDSSLMPFAAYRGRSAR